jgi:hypothetical protein
MFQMCKYRERLQSRLSTPDPSSVLDQPSPTGNMEKWLTMDSQYGLSHMDIMMHGNKQETSVDQEYMLYITSPVTSPMTDLVSYWEVCINNFPSLCFVLLMATQTARSQYPTFFRMAMDYLPIQASAVPCERAFSSGAETLTARRNRIKPPIMEALQMLKFALKKSRLNFTCDWLTTEAAMDEDDSCSDPLTLLSEEGGIDKVAKMLVDEDEIDV